MESRVIGVGHAEHLAPSVSSLINNFGVEISSIDEIAVTVGPGSFMGARVGLSFAAGLALPRGLVTRPITTLEALWLSAPKDAAGAVLIDARRGQVYGQAFGPAREKRSEPFLLGHDEARARLGAQPGTLVGSGAALLYPEAEITGPATPDLALLLAAAQLDDPGLCDVYVFDLDVGSDAEPCRLLA